MFWTIGNAQCKCGGAKNATYSVVSSNLYEQQQHTAPSPPKSINTSEHRNNAVYKQSSYILAKKAARVYENPAQSAMQLSGSSVTKSCALPCIEHTYINIFIQPIRICACALRIHQPAIKRNNSWSRTEHTMPFHTGQRQSRDFTHICAAWETYLMCGDTDKGKSKKDKLSCS